MRSMRRRFRAHFRHLRRRWPLQSDVQRLAQQLEHVLLVATRSGEIVGYAHGEVQEAAAGPYKRASALLHVHAMGVTAAHRGCGVGHALVTAVHAAAAARGLTEVSLEVYAFNTDARTFYEREGFLPLRERLVAPVRARDR
jgi:GNAT superfamily N-acetyltransferase